MPSMFPRLTECGRCENWFHLSFNLDFETRHCPFCQLQVVPPVAEKSFAELGEIGEFNDLKLLSRHGYGKIYQANVEGEPRLVTLLDRGEMLYWEQRPQELRAIRRPEVPYLSDPIAINAYPIRWFGDMAVLSVDPYVHAPLARPDRSECKLDLSQKMHLIFACLKYAKLAGDVLKPGEIQLGDIHFDGDNQIRIATLAYPFAGYYDVPNEASSVGFPDVTQPLRGRLPYVLTCSQKPSSVAIRIAGIGCLLLHLLTGQRQNFRGTETPNGYQHRVRTMSKVESHLPPSLTPVIRKMWLVDVDKGHEYESFEEVEQDLRQLNLHAPEFNTPKPRWTSRGSNHDFRKINWGMPLAEVEAAEQNHGVIADEMRREVKSGYQSLPLSVSYEFVEDRDATPRCAAVTIKIEPSSNMTNRNLEQRRLPNSNSELAHYWQCERQAREWRREGLYHESKGLQVPFPNLAMDVLAAQRHADSIQRILRGALTDWQRFHYLIALLNKEYGAPKWGVDWSDYSADWLNVFQDFGINVDGPRMPSSELTWTNPRSYVLLTVTPRRWAASHLAVHLFSRNHLDLLMSRASSKV